MGVPGFTAESAVYRTSGHYRVRRSGGATGRRQSITPQDDSHGYCSMVECPAICSRYCNANPYGFACKKCLKDCRAGCIPDSDGYR
ncbi:hypothetical protein [Streptomyces sp. NPDC051183]|uniref:hypothetical protein n=1 Tax=unclassified Streptomyces TaxID=2593676 RepID=UPI003414AA5B